MKIAFWALIFSITFNLPAFASTVRVEQTANGWRLLRDGQPYSVKGACVWGDDARGWFAPLEELAVAGANSARTYWEGDAQSTLDRAHRLGLTVTLGLTVDKPRHGFDFGDPKVLEAQENRLRAAVTKYKDHPALLVWGIGNEVELQRDEPAQREQIFRVLNRLSRLVKTLDPNHPTVIVTAGMDAAKAAQVKEWCRDVDIIGINAYGLLPTLPAKLSLWKFERPYFIAEWGPRGYWETPQTPWKAPLEPTSSEKAAQLEKSYSEGVVGDTRRCLGSYAFFWGQKQETTATWFGLFLKSGERVNAQDALVKAWTGKAPPFPCPTISPIELTGEKFVVGETIAASVQVSSARPVTIEWLLARESTDLKAGGDAEKAPEFSREGISNLGNGKVQITVPKEAGAYRIFVFARDDKGGAATANAPIWIDK